MPDILKHNIIEASAGTGKTFIIENLFVEILKKTGVGIEKILAVTFTEKAAGELKKRIRECIKKSAVSEKDPKIRQRLQQSLCDFDKASIYTIHGFCSRLLREYSFENGSLFTFEMIDDDAIYEKMLHAQMRSEWKARYGRYLEEILEFSGFSNPVKCKKLILKAAKIFTPSSNVKIIPEINGNFIGDIEAVKTQIGKFAEKASELLRYEKGKDCRDGHFYKSLPLVVKGRSLEKFKREFFEYLAGLLSCEEDDLKIKSAYEFFHCFKETKSVREYFESIVFKESGSEADDLFELAECTEIFFSFLKQSEWKVTGQLAVQSAGLLRRDAQRYKKQNGMISYDDMIISVDDALKKDSFIDAMRSKFEYGIVDEFQDTDFLQWDIIKNIFPHNGKGRLFLIADPKQAIYGFRGADIFTYFSAKSEMSASYRCNHVELDTNFRSSKKITGVLNHFFSVSGYFNGISGNITYNPVNSSDKNTVGNGRPVLTVFDLGSCSPGNAKKIAASYVAKEIIELLKSDIKINLKNETRNLTAKDICVLIRKAAEASDYEKEFREKKIPYSFYKKAGLYNTAEAKNIYYLFNALANPDDSQAFRKSLLTGFFNLKPAELENIKFDGGSEIIRIFDKWRFLSDNREYRKLFRSIITESGLIYRELGEDDGERKITNMEHILQNLEKNAMNDNLDMTRIAVLLKNLIRNEVESDEGENLQKRETEDDKVQIMTIHASKGLEFPVVFIGGGFTKKNQYDYYKFHDEAILVYDLNKSQENKKKNEREETEEEKRLYYVAMTRAVFYLYVPYLEPERKIAAGPLTTFMTDCIKKAFMDNVHPDAGIINVKGVMDKKDAAIDYFSRLKDEGRIMLPETLLPVIDRNISYRLVTVKSFSGIKREKEMIHDVRENDELHDGFEKIMDDGLPGGNMTGNMFHGILEKTDYGRFKDFKNADDVMSDEDTMGIINELFGFYIEKRLSSSEKHKAPSYLKKTCEIVFNTLKTPLDGSGFRICDIAASDRLNEAEFYFSLPEIKNTPQKRYKFEYGFLKGFIDLVFRKNGKYYFADWKSNRYPEFSGEEFFGRVKADYELQYKVYTIAVIRWLKSRIKNFDYDSHFGGIYYIYLRARNAENPENGLFYYREKAEPLLSYENELRDII